MKRTIVKTTIALFVLLFIISGVISAEETNTNEPKTLQSILSAVQIGGGISAGYFYTSNPGEDTSDDAFLLSNVLIELSSADEELPVGFAAAFGQTSTHSLLGTPEANEDYGIEYGSLTLTPIPYINLEIGLLESNSGFESTYAFDNNNVILGTVASQQPYNAYGARAGYEINGFSVWGGYYKDRLDDEEYNSPDYAWEIWLGGSFAGNDISLYNYHIGGERNLLGAVIEREIDNISLAFNLDYWRWSNSKKEMYAGRSSIGAAFYICPNFDKFSLPIRIEYVNQHKSEIYIESPDTQKIYTLSISPTWHFNNNAFIRGEYAYVRADQGFTNEDGDIKDDRNSVAIEVGYKF